MTVRSTIGAVHLTTWVREVWRRVAVKLAGVEYLGKVTR